MLNEPKFIQENTKPKPVNHACLLYESDEEWVNAVMPFLAAGITQKEKCICVVNKHLCTLIENQLIDIYNNITPEQVAAQLIMIKCEPSDQDRLSAFIGLITDAALTAHKDDGRGIRLVNELNLILGKKSNSIDSILDYETSLNQDFITPFSSTVLCSLSMQQFNIRAIKALVRTHPFYIRNNKIYCNSHYSPLKKIPESKCNRQQLDDWLAGQTPQQGEVKYRNLFNKINEAVVLYDIIPDENGQPCDFRFKEVNPAFEKQSRLTQADLIGHTLREILNGLDTEWINFFIFAVINHKTTVIQKYSNFMHKDLVASIFHSTPQQLGVITIDISKLKQLEKKQKEQLHFLQNLIDAIPSPVFYKNTAGVYKVCNKAYANILGLSREQIIGRTYYDITPCPTADSIRENDHQLFEHPQVQLYDGMIPYADGTLHDVILNKAPIFNMSRQLTGLVGVTIDITAQKHTEEALNINKEKFQNIFFQSPIGILIFDVNGELSEVNPACMAIFGVANQASVNGFNLFADFNMPDYIKKRLLKSKIFKNEFKIDFDIIKKELHFPTDKTGCAYLSYIITPLKSQQNKTHGFLCQIQDITERRKSALALKMSETQLRRITGTMQDIICQTDLSGIVQYISPSIYHVLGYDPMNIIGSNFWKLTHPDDIASVMEENNRTVTRGSYQKIEFRYQHHNGQWVWLEAVGNPLWDEHGKMVGIVLGIRDINERKHMEKEMARLDRLRLAGEMAATIGHEIRNPMTTVHGFLQMLRNEPDCSRFHDYFDLMIEELNAANSIIREFLSLAQNKVVYLKAQNLNDIVKNIYPLMAAEALKSDKQIVLNLGSIATVGIDSNEIRQLILNLALNGLDAMDSGGILIISTYMHDDQIVLAVKDHGRGIDPAITDKLGTPFVTTKENGTGLGLAVCYSIAGHHNATLDYKTGANGTTFLVKFNSEKKM